nr:phospholipase-like protein [Tanacetum cinerariifolium]
SRWRHCKFPWCNDVVMDRPFWDSLIGLDDNRLGKVYFDYVFLFTYNTLIFGYGTYGILDDPVKIDQWRLVCLLAKEMIPPTTVLSLGIQNVPKQGGVFGDYGVFVCLFLYRLAHGIPLDVEDPIQTVLAYREKKINFFFDHKIIFPS